MPEAGNCCWILVYHSALPLFSLMIFTNRKLFKCSHVISVTVQMEKNKLYVRNISSAMLSKDDCKSALCIFVCAFLCWLCRFISVFIASLVTCSSSLTRCTTLEQIWFEWVLWFFMTYHEHQSIIFIFWWPLVANGIIIIVTNICDSVAEFGGIYIFFIVKLALLKASTCCDYLSHTHCYELPHTKFPMICSHLNYKIS